MDRSAHRRHRTRLACAGVTLLTAAMTVGLAGTADARKASAKPGAKTAQAAHLASETVSEVVTLHDLALAVRPGSGLPQSRSSFSHLATEFAAQATACAAIGKPAAALGTTLSAYRKLASQVATNVRKANAKLPSTFAASIRGNDKKWKAALTSIGKADHANLLKSVPKLLYPKAAGK